MMKKQLLTITALALLTGATSQAETIRIGTEGAYPPWNYVDESGELAGFEIELGGEICALIEADCEFVQNSWDSLIPNLEGGNYDVIMAGMSITDERKEAINFTTNYYPADPSLYAAKEGTELDFENLSGARIGVQVGTVHADYLKENFAENNTILSYDDPDQTIADLMANNVDVVFADGSFLKPNIDAIDELQAVGPTVTLDDGVGAGLRKADEELLTQFNEALTSLKSDGTLDALILKYFEKETNFANSTATQTEEAEQATETEQVTEEAKS